MLQQATPPGGSWPAAAIHDTVAAIMRQANYHRSLRASFADRVWNWIWEQVARLTSGVASIPGGRYIALGAALALVGLVAARMLYGAKLREEEAARVRARHQARTYGDPWTEAERAAAQGRYTDAAHALNAAVLERLARRERLRLHPSKTHGDYARELRARQSGAYGPFRQFGRLYDVLIYGRGECDAPGYAALLERAAPFLSQDRAA